MKYLKTIVLTCGILSANAVAMDAVNTAHDPLFIHKEYYESCLVTNEGFVEDAYEKAKVSGMEFAEQVREGAMHQLDEFCQERTAFMLLHNITNKVDTPNP